MSLKASISLFFTIVMLIAAGPLFAQDTIAKPSVPASQEESALKSKVDYSARDSIRFDVVNQKMYLFGDSKVLYEDMTLKADYIEFDMSKNIAYSRGARDSAGKVLLDSLRRPIGDPVFSESGKSFDAKELTYNFKTKKGKIRDVTTKEGEAYIHAKEAKKDTGDVYFIKNGRYTTCDHDNPHFYLQATKIKIIPDDKIIIGPAYLAISDVPTPLGLPFGVFPNKKGRKSGVLIPAYGESAERGFFLKDGGYYFGLSDYFDLALRGDIYSLGSFGLKGNSNYSKRYKYAGNLGLSFSQLEPVDDIYDTMKPPQDFFVRWQHAQDVKANPSSRFSANVNAGSQRYQQYNSNSDNDYLSNTFSSNIAWNKSWQGRPFNLMVNMAHSQTTRPKTKTEAEPDPVGKETVVDLTAPEVVFTRSRGFPFKRRNHFGKPRIYEKIGASFSVNGKNQITTYDSLLFKPQTLEKMRNGLTASVPISVSQNVGPVIFSASENIRGYGYFQSYEKQFDTVTEEVIVDTLPGFKYAFDYNTLLSASAKLYGMFSYKNAKVKAIRHVMTPIVSFNYKPDFGEPHYGYYDSVQTSASDEKLHLYSHYENSVYGSPAAGKFAAVNFALNNNLEMKLRPSKKDTLGQDRKVMLIDNLTISSFYNIAAETFKWSTINVAARTQLFKKFDITLNGVIDPYAYDTALGRRIERFQFDMNSNVGTLTSGMFALSTSLRSLVKKKDPKAKVAQKRSAAYEDELNYIQNHPDYYVDFNVPWDLSVYYNIVYTKLRQEDSALITQSLSFNGNVSVTDKWKVGVRSGFDFVLKDFTYTSLDIYRDLHCWEMRLNWVPFGFRKSYMLSIAVKASVLQDLKLNRNRNWYDYN